MASSDEHGLYHEFERQFDAVLDSILHCGGQKKRKIKANDEEDCDNDDDKQAVTTVTTTHEAIGKYFKIADDDLPDGIQDLQKNFFQNICPFVIDLLLKGFNILLYGIGNKTNILQSIEQSLSCSIDLVKFSPALTKSMHHKQLLTEMADFFKVDTAKKFLTVVEIAQAICNKTEHIKEPQLIFIVEYLDAKLLRDAEIQKAFSLLASSRAISFLATVEHINFSLLWPRDISQNFAFHYIPVSNYRLPISVLMESDSPLLGLSTKSTLTLHTIETLDSIWASLTTNAQESFKILYELLHQEDTDGDVTFLNLLDACRDAHCVSTETQLRQILVEFTDHSMIRLKNHVHFGEVIHMIIPDSLVEQFIAQHILKE